MRGDSYSPTRRKKLPPKPASRAVPYKGEPEPKGGSFEVTVQKTIGTVTYGDFEGDPPVVAAFKMIAEYEEPGVYSFPLEDGEGMARVTVEYFPTQ